MPALADSPESVTGSLAHIPWHELAALALVLGIALFAVVSAVMLLRTRARAAAERAAYRAEIDALRTSAGEAQTLLLSEPQVLIVWPADGRDADLIGDAALLVPEDPPVRIGAFETWLAPDAAAAINNAVTALRAEGQGFSKTVTTRQGRQIEATGRAVGGRAVLRLRDLSPIKRELTEATAQKQKLQRELETVGSLIEALPSPVWARDKAGRLVFVNKAYARAEWRWAGATCRYRWRPSARARRGRGADAARQCRHRYRCHRGRDPAPRC
jgi:PAS domain-containing protein